MTMRDRADHRICAGAIGWAPRVRAGWPRISTRRAGSSCKGRRDRLPSDRSPRKMKSPKEGSGLCSMPTSSRSHDIFLLARSEPARDTATQLFWDEVIRRIRAQQKGIAVRSMPFIAKFASATYDPVRRSVACTYTELRHADRPSKTGYSTIFRRLMIVLVLCFWAFGPKDLARESWTLAVTSPLIVDHRAPARAGPRAACRLAHEPAGVLHRSVLRRPQRNGHRLAHARRWRTIR